MNDADPSALQGKLSSLAGQPIADEDVAAVLRDVVAEGGGISIDVDHVRFKLLRRDGKFVLKKEDPRSQSTIPPPLRRGR